MNKFSLFGFEVTFSKVVVKSGSKPRITEEQKNDIIEMKKEGFSNTDISFATGVSVSSVSRITREHKKDLEVEQCKEC